MVVLIALLRPFQQLVLLNDLYGRLAWISGRTGGSSIRPLAIPTTPTEVSWNAMTLGTGAQPLCTPGTRRVLYDPPRLHEDPIDVRRPLIANLLGTKGTSYNRYHSPGQGQHGTAPRRMDPRCQLLVGNREHGNSLLCWKGAEGGEIRIVHD